MRQLEQQQDYAPWSHTDLNSEYYLVLKHSHLEGNISKYCKRCLNLLLLIIVENILTTTDFLWKFILLMQTT